MSKPVGTYVRTFSDDQAAAIRWEVFNGAYMTDVARREGVSGECIRLLVRGRTYADCGGPIQDGPRWKWATGDRCGSSKLTPEQVREALASTAYGDQTRLAREWGVNQSTISHIQAGDWRKREWSESMASALIFGDDAPGGEA